MALSSGVPPEHVSKALGHDSIKTTEKSYAKWIRDRQVLVVNSLAASWKRQRNLVNIEAQEKEGVFRQCQLAMTQLFVNRSTTDFGIRSVT